MHISSKTPNRSNLYNMQLAKGERVREVTQDVRPRREGGKVSYDYCIKDSVFQTGLEIGKITKCL